MTKNILLSAVALGAMVFAGSAGAGTLTSGQISTVPVASTTGAGVTTLTPYTVASEATIPAAGISAVAADSFLTTTLASGVSLGGGASITLIVTYTLTGPGTFASVAYDDLEAVIGGVATSPTSGVATLAADKKSVQFIVSYASAGGATIDAFTLNDVALKVASKADVSIASNVKLVVGATETTLDTTEATKIVQFKSALKDYAAVSDTVIADLPDFLAFEAKTAATGRPATATTTVATSDVLGLAVNTGVRKDLTGAAALTLANVVTAATATVTGPQVETLAATLGGVAPAAATLTATSGVYTLTPALLGTGALVLTAPGDETIEAGTYKASVKLTAATGFSGLPETSVTLLGVALDGTNFYAPWFALGNTTANSTLRLANNSSAPTGPITIVLKANNGSAAPTGVYSSTGIAPGAFLSIRGDQLKAAFGTDALNGDLQVTIQSDVANVSAKVRTTQVTGQIYENSLGANPPSN